MKGIALICRQIGHLDSVWFLMPDDTVMPLSLSLTLPINLSSLSASCPLSLSPGDAYTIEKIKEKSEGMKKAQRRKKTVLDYYNKFLCYYPTEIYSVYACVLLCVIL